MRFKLTIEYDGEAFCGWQRQDEGASVQGVLEDALYKLTGENAEIIGAGRTDSGVHALGQVAHVEIEKPFRQEKLRDAINAHLRPHPVAVLAATAVDSEFHARFDAIKRVYRYRIVNRRAPLALERGKAWLVQRTLNAAAMDEAAQHLVGQHDFTTFRDANCQARSPVKTLDRCDVERAGDVVEVWCEARSFLHRQVRSIVGTLVEVGMSKMSAGGVAAALAAKDRTQCGPVAPADGLYLVRVGYELK